MRTATNRCQALRGFDTRARSVCISPDGRCKMDSAADGRMNGSNNAAAWLTTGTALLSIPSGNISLCGIAGNRSLAVRCCAARILSIASRESWRLLCRKFDRCDCPNPVWRANNETLTVPLCILRSNSRRRRSCICVKFICGNSATSNTGGDPSFSTGKAEGPDGLHFERFVTNMKVRMQKSTGEH